jgi:hypothetical protein
MLITFKSKAHQNVTMMQDHAQRILDLLNKDPERGVITAEEAPQAVQLLENEIDESRKHQATDEVEQDVRAHHGDVQDAEHEQAETVTFPTRAYPLLEMLRAARDQGADVLWGV